MEPSLVEMPEILWFDWNHSLKDDVIANYGNGRAMFEWPGVQWYTEYYQYYPIHPYDGVIIKAHDDIVHVNSSMVRPYAEYLWIMWTYSCFLHLWSIKDCVLIINK
jgi:hypothetical protein